QKLSFLGQGLGRFHVAGVMERREDLQWRQRARSTILRAIGRRPVEDAQTRVRQTALVEDVKAAAATLFGSALLPSEVGVGPLNQFLQTGGQGWEDSRTRSVLVQQAPGEKRGVAH